MSRDLRLERLRRSRSATRHRIGRLDTARPILCGQAYLLPGGNNLVQRGGLGPRRLLGEAGSPITSVWLPGRRAGLEVVENLLTSKPSPSGVLLPWQACDVRDARGTLIAIRVDGRLAMG
jgi:hypothetical protein